MIRAILRLIFGYKSLGPDITKMDICHTCAFVGMSSSGSKMECRRNSPQIYQSITKNVKSGWPEVAFDDWCYQYKRKTLKYHRKTDSDAAR